MGCKSTEELKKILKDTTEVTIYTNAEVKRIKSKFRVICEVHTRPDMFSCSKITYTPECNAFSSITNCIRINANFIKREIESIGKHQPIRINLELTIKQLEIAKPK